MTLSQHLTGWMDDDQPVILVEVTSIAGSAPRAAGAAMIVSSTQMAGTIGGGALEDLAIRSARKMLTNGDDSEAIDQALGPEIGQCCGGRVALLLRLVTTKIAKEFLARETTQRAAAPHVFIFGAGHTGSALAYTLARLPFHLTIIDQRADWLAPLANYGATVESPLPEAEVAKAPAGAAFVIMTHDHALDFMIAEAALTKGDAAYVGMIGSSSKRAALVSTLTAQGVSADQLICPIGEHGPSDKRPEIIALSTAAEIAAVLL